MIDYYKILDIQYGATAKEIKSAYRKKALKYHPDKNHSPEAELKFIRATEAYEVLNNPSKKGVYDNYFRNQNNSNIDQTTHQSDRQNKEREWSQYGREKAAEYASTSFETFISKVYQTGRDVSDGLGYMFVIFIVGCLVYMLTLAVYFILKGILTAENPWDIENKGELFLFFLVYYLIMRKVFKSIKSFLYPSKEEKQGPFINMNRKQAICIVCGIIIIILMGIYPPFNAHRLYISPPEFIGYSFIWSYPEIDFRGLVEIEFETLLDQWVGTGILTAFFYWIFKD